MHRKCLGVLFALLVLTTELCVADEAHMGATGGSLKMMEGHKSIRMVSEYVKLRVQATRVDVYCKFIFRNEGRATTVRMGFPEDCVYDDDGFDYFRSRVDAKHVSLRQIKPRSPELYTTDDRGWRVKTVRFGAWQTRVVEDWYGGPIGHENFLMAMYTLKTGRSWHGPIGSAVITADISAARNLQTFIPSPSGYRRGRNTITWTFHNFEPKEDILINIDPSYRWFVVNGRDVSVGIQGGDDPKSYPLMTKNGIVVWDRDLVDLLPGAKMLESKSGCTLKYKGKTLDLRSGSRAAYLNGKKQLLPCAVCKVEDGVTLPLEPVGRAFGFKITHDRLKGKTYISAPSLKTHSGRK